MWEGETSQRKWLRKFVMFLIIYLFYFYLLHVHFYFMFVRTFINHSIYFINICIYFSQTRTHTKMKWGKSGIAVSWGQSAYFYILNNWYSIISTCVTDITSHDAPSDKCRNSFFPLLGPYTWLYLLAHCLLLLLPVFPFQVLHIWPKNYLTGLYRTIGIANK